MNNVEEDYQKHDDIPSFGDHSRHNWLGNLLQGVCEAQLLPSFLFSVVRLVPLILVISKRATKWPSSNFDFSLSSDYLHHNDRIGGDLDAMDNIQFAAGPVNLPGGLGNDVISFGDYKSQEYRPE